MRDDFVSVMKLATSAVRDGVEEDEVSGGMIVGALDITKSQIPKAKSHCASSLADRMAKSQRKDAEKPTKKKCLVLSAWCLESVWDDHLALSTRH
jgi:hypothetical protein